MMRFLVLMLFQDPAATSDPCKLMEELMRLSEMAAGMSVFVDLHF